MYPTGKSLKQKPQTGLFALSAKSGLPYCTFVFVKTHLFTHFEFAIGWAVTAVIYSKSVYNMLAIAVIKTECFFFFLNHMWYLPVGLLWSFCGVF